MKIRPILLIIAVFSTCMSVRLEAKTPWLARIFQRRGMESSTAFMLGVDMEKLREIVMVEKGTNITEEAIQREIEKRLSDDIDDRILEVVRRRVDGMGINEPVIQLAKGHRVLVQLPGTNAVTRAEVRRALQRTAYLEFRLAHPNNSEKAKELMDGLKKRRERALNVRLGPEGYNLNESGDGFVRLPDYDQIKVTPGHKARLSSFGRPPQGYQFMLERDKEGFYQPNYIRRKAQLTGRDIVSARVDRDEVGRTAVAFKLSSKGGSAMRRMSGQNIGRQLAIILDGELISVPVLKSEIGRFGQISGNFTSAEAKRLSDDLNAGALPVPLTVLAEESFGSFGRQPDEHP